MHNFSGKADSLIACYQENIWEGLIVGYKSKLIKHQNISDKGDLAYLSTTLLSREFSVRQTQQRGKNNLDFSYWTWSTPWGNVLIL